MLIENYRPGTLERMGFGPDALHARNPRLIIVRISGWGQTGPYAGKPGFGTLVEGMSGFAAKTGFADREPVLPPTALADMIAGLYGMAATMTALREIETKGGKGQVIDLSLLEAMHSVVGADAGGYKATGHMPKRLGSRSNTASPRNVFKTRDGRWISVSGSMQSMAERLYTMIGRADMISDPRFATNSARLANTDEAERPIREFIARQGLCRMPRPVRAGRGHRGAGLRHRPVRRRSACAGAAGGGRGARRRGRQRDHAQHPAAALGDARRAAHSRRRSSGSTRRKSLAASASMRPPLRNFVRKELSDG